MEDFDATTSMTVPEAAVDNDLELLTQALPRHRSI
jgi:hypothetical protein